MRPQYNPKLTGVHTYGGEADALVDKDPQYNCQGSIMSSCMGVYIYRDRIWVYNVPKSPTLSADWLLDLGVTHQERLY